eukprot:IDg13800t1
MGVAAGTGGADVAESPPSVRRPRTLRAKLWNSSATASSRTGIVAKWRMTASTLHREQRQNDGAAKSQHPEEMAALPRAKVRHEERQPGSRGGAARARAVGVSHLQVGFRVCLAVQLEMFLVALEAGLTQLAEIDDLRGGASRRRTQLARDGSGRGIAAWDAQHVPTFAP